jgi:hypothetical protein
MQSQATSVEQYLSELPEDRRAALQAIREVILKYLPTGYAEGMQYGMIGYFVPHSRYPAGYHCDPRQPLPFGGLASQKNHMAVYLMGLYGNSAAEAAFRAAWSKTGRKLDMGKCCIRFKRLEDLPLEVLGDTIAAMPVDKYIAAYEKALGSRGGKSSSPAKSKSAKSKSAKSKSAKSKVAPARPQKSATVKSSAKKPPVKKPPVKKLAVKKLAVKKSPVKQSAAAKKASPKKAASKKAAPKRTSAKQVVAKKSAPKSSRSK